MAWPSSGSLSKSNFDAGTDSPSSARAELEALYDHVLLISNEVTDGATVWHSGNDGATSGLDADLLDGQHGSYYQDAGNLNAGTIALARIPTNLTGKNADQLDGQEGSYYQNASNLNAGTVPLARLSGITGAQIASSTISQGNLNTGQTAISQARSTADHGVNGTLSGGEYSFYPEIQHDYGGGGSLVNFAAITIWRGSEQDDIGYLLNINFRWDIEATSSSTTAYARSRYINASPPHKINNIDYKEFIFIKINSNSEIMGVSVSTDPPWYHNGPTITTPDYIDPSTGRKYIHETKISKDNNIIKYAKSIRNGKKNLLEIDDKIKNFDMPIIPHPFLTLLPGERVLIIEPNDSGDYVDACALFNSGENVNALFHKGYFKIDNTEIPTNGRPPGVSMHRIKWK